MVDSFATVVENGILPGRQGNFRAGLYAACAAIKSANSASLFSDNLAASSYDFGPCFTQTRFLHVSCDKPRLPCSPHLNSHTKPKASETRHHNKAADNAAATKARS